MRTIGCVAAVLALLLGSASGTALADGGFTSVDFASAGEIEVRADLYESPDRSATLILLFHQAGWSRGEYREIAPKLVKLGYRVMAIDQRSGGGVNGVQNETARRAKKRHLPTSYLDAYPDLEAALAYARKDLKATRVIVWGSSYSASLVFRLAAEHPAQVSAIVAFSPGEYFDEKGGDYIRALAKKLSQPLFVTSSKQERDKVKPIFDASTTKQKILFTPASKGQHGSRALWAQWPDNDVYWAAVDGFLDVYMPPRPRD